MSSSPDGERGIRDVLRDYWNRDAATYDISNEHELQTPTQRAVWASILDRLLPLYGRQIMYSVLAEAVAAEQVARRIAMKLASDNASDMVNLLTRQYNRARQALITKEIAEILGGAEALKD